MVSDQQKTDARRVLIVDESPDSREVLRTVLERRGVQIYEADGPSTGLDLARKCDPDLIVVDVETVSPSDTCCDGFGDQANRDHTPVVLLGSVRTSQLGPSTAQVVSKPYHYGALIRKIEELLQQSQLPMSE